MCSNFCQFLIFFCFCINFSYFLFWNFFIFKLYCSYCWNRLYSMVIYKNSLQWTPDIPQKNSDHPVGEFSLSDFIYRENTQNWFSLSAIKWKSCHSNFTRIRWEKHLRNFSSLCAIVAVVSFHDLFSLASSPFRKIEHT